MTTTDIHVPITLNENFAVMCCLLVRSIAARAKLPGNWRVVFTVSRDSTLDVDSPLFDWAKEYPVEFHWVDQNRWAEYNYHGTGLQRHLYDHKADVVLFMDADIVITGPIDGVIQEIVATDSIAGCPAWQPPPDIDWNEVFLRRGLPLPKLSTIYSGYGLSFMSPKYAPPYFNYGFVAVSKRVALEMRDTLAEDLDFVCRGYSNYFNSQIALCLNIVRNHYNFQTLDMRYNCGSGDMLAPAFSGPEADACYDMARAVIHNHRVLHYCAPTADFSKTREMGNWENLRAFCDRTGLGQGAARVQRGLNGLL